jgi:hypothetical protein
MIDRRGIIRGAAALGVGALAPSVGSAEVAGARARSARNGAPTNHFQHARALTTPKTQTVTAPNNDTLYSSAWIDLSQGPVRITLPASGQRYFSLHLMDAYTNGFAVLGSRNSGPDGYAFTLVGPTAPLPDGDAVRSPTPWVWGLVRTLVGGQADLAAAHAVQDGIRLEGPPGRKAGAFAARDAAWPEVFASVQALVLEAPPPATDHAFFAQCAALGLTPRGGFDARRFSSAEGAEIAEGLSEALKVATDTANGSRPMGRWIYPKFDLGAFGQDYHYRAQIALGSLAALPVDEALYARPMAPSGGDRLDSRLSWKLRFPKGGLPPVDAFWSLTLYEVTPAGQAFLIDNPLNRYAIGDRTPGLVYGPDGSLEILISPTDPGGAARVNWLPAPTSGAPMLLSMRAYLPRAEFLNGRYQYPPLTPVKGRA